MKSPTPNPTIVDEPDTWPPRSPQDDVPAGYDVDEAIRSLANRKKVESNGLRPNY